jgi:hypothetical protein
MIQDYTSLSPDQIEDIEKQTLRVITQAIQQYSKEAKQIFDYTEASSDTEIIVLGEDITQYALEVAECYPINKRYAGFIDYKRVRWFSSIHGLVPQALLVDAKASTENSRDTLQQSQLPFNAEFEDKSGTVWELTRGIPDLEIECHSGDRLPVLNTSALVHLYYDKNPSDPTKQRDLKSIYILGLPSEPLKPKYNPDPKTAFFGQGKHSPARGEDPRIRVYFTRLKAMCPWRVQELKFDNGDDYSTPLWTDYAPDGVMHSQQTFYYLPR